ncbi:MAG: hypothetical protein HYZ74_04920 [Elusimicrobia bacterium]|nr:hypothetical protein [Elusimicrobiota bacterium]
MNPLDDPFDSSSGLPRPIPPVPPRPELFASPPSAPAAAAANTPIMDFFQKRLEALERELALERERASSAQALLHQQDALKSEVESHLLSLSDQLRREKIEKEGEEAKSHARGRVEALERRLDEMNATFAQLLREAVSRQAAPAAGLPVESLGAELTVFRRTIKDIADQVNRWRDEMKDLPALLPEVRGIASRIPEDERRFEDLISRRLDDFATKLQGTLSDWERRHDLELRKQDDRLQSLVDELAALSRMWEEQGQSIRQEFLKDRIARETEVSDQVAELAKRLDGVARVQADSGTAAESVRETLARIMNVLLAAPKAKDEIIVELEQEKADMMRSMRERHEQLRATLEERRQIEKTMGESLLQLSDELEKERALTRAADARAADARGETEALARRVGDLEKALAERDTRALALTAERDELTRALVAEADKVSVAIAERTAADERWHQRLIELQRKVEDEAASTGQASAATGELRAKVATLSEHMTRALQERDAVVARFSDWERERQRLLDALKQKEGMLSMISGAFQSSLKKP